MNDSNSQQNGLVWRTITPEDEAALVRLDAACKEVDGVEPVSNLVRDVLRAAGVDSNNTLGVAAYQDFAGVAWVQAESVKEGVQHITLGGQVHPDFRRRGIGEALLSWSENRALALGQPETTMRMIIRNESLTADANVLYLDFGYENIFTEFMLVRSLEESLPVRALPEEITEYPWNHETAPLFFQAYAEGFRDRLGDIEPDQDEWISGYAEEDEDFRPDLSRVFYHEGTPVAFVTCEVAGSTGWISQVAVVQARRRSGLAHTLMLQALARLQAAGCSEAALHVNANNARAAAVFLDIGFKQRLVRARFTKDIALGK